MSNGRRKKLMRDINRAIERVERAMAHALEKRALGEAPKREKPKAKPPAIYV
jgi:hypothetical protein